MAEISIIKDKEHFEKVLEEAGDKVVIVDFFATWCGPCKTISPVLQKLANEFKDKLLAVKIDVDNDHVQDLVKSYGVTIMPTFVFIKNGEQVEKFTGANPGKLEETIKNHTQ